MRTRTIKVDYLARVEGEGALHVKLRGDKVIDVQFRIFEPPRFFEAFLRGRSYAEAPDITARICGICPIAYQMSTVHAIEDAFGLKVDGQLRALRRLIYCGEWIESHALHVYFLHAPDFLGYEDALQIARDHPELVKRALRLKKIGNELMTVLGGREIHPVNVRVGGFYRVPHPRELSVLVDELRWARDFAVETVRWTAALDFPEFSGDHEFVALRHPDEYALNEGRLVSNRGLDIAARDYERHFSEEHVERSNALHSALQARGAYFVGPLARFNLNFDRLSPLAQDAARSVGFLPESQNPFKSIIARGVELVYACDEALRIIEAYKLPDRPAVETSPRMGRGYGCTEAPRGLLYHRYKLDDQGLIPPTSQNQKSIESDLWRFVPTCLDLDQEKLTLRCEQLVRNYDPCISCATHFLRLKVERE
jgi:coenzyme F420-reducing hydrogenase alpha subunit